MPARPARKTVSLVLGSGGARGLAHIAVLQVLDDLGIRPSALAGTSIGMMSNWLLVSALPGKAQFLPTISGQG